MDHIKATLAGLGLDEKETILYLASLRLGESGMSELAKQAHLKRTSAYVVFKSLEQKGLMGSFQMRQGTRFVATPPEILIAKAKNQAEQLDKLLPELKAFITKPDQAPKVSYYEGLEGYKIATEDSLKVAKATLRHIGSLADLHRAVTYQYDIDYYLPQRVRQQIQLKALYFSSELGGVMRGRNNIAELREIRSLPEKYHHHTSTLIYDDKVVYFSSAKELVTVIVESAALAESEKQKFDLIWDLVGAAK